MARLFEQTADNNPNSADRLAFERSGQPTRNITFANFLTWLGNNFTLPVNTAVVNIGDWNMDTTNAVSIAHGITGTITAISVSIIPDIGSTYDGTVFDFLKPADVASGVFDGGGLSWSATNVLLYRTLSAFFDNANFDATSFNRGYITINYTS